jgi:hypothetical protein
MNRQQTIRHGTFAFAGAFLMFASVSSASTGSCASPDGSAGCSTVDQAFLSIVPANNSFEGGDPAGTNFIYNPSIATQGGTGWTFNSSGGNTGGGGGALIYGSNWYAAPAPDGGEVAGLQQFTGSTAQASISQVINGFIVGNFYDVNFDIAQRDIPALGISPGDTIEVLLGGQILGTYTPTTTTWTAVTTSTIQAATTSMNLQFLSMSTGTLASSEVDTLFDDVIIADPVPEPAAFWLVAGSLGLLAAGRKMRTSGARTFRV